MSASAKPGNLTVKRLSPTVGALVEGMRLGPDMSEDAIALVLELLTEHYVLVFPRQQLSPQDLRELTARFGPLFHHHEDEGVLQIPGVPEVLEMRKEPHGTRLFGGSDWHADVTFRSPAGFVSILHALVIPPIGGDTGFASGVVAFETLSSGMQDLLRGLHAVHNYDGPGHPDRDGQTAVHPVVRKHPLSAREGLYLNRMFVSRFEGMTEAESEAMLEFLGAHMTRPEFTCRVRWARGHVVMWDNRFSLHYPINDFSGQRRLLIRCTAMEADGAGQAGQTRNS